MKHLKWMGPLLLFAGLLSLASCSKEEAPAAPAEEMAVSEESTEAADEAAAVSAEEAASETLELVEESASEAEPVDEAIVLAVAELPVAKRDWQFKEGQHYVRLVPTQPTVGSADKIEVAEFFWYGCPHCYDMEPYINQWAENKDPNVRFVRIPATWNALVRLHAQLYYTEEVLARNGILKRSGRIPRCRFSGVSSPQQPHDVGSRYPEAVCPLRRQRGAVPGDLGLI